MAARDPLKFPYTRGLPRPESMKAALGKEHKRPVTGVTQGGSSRKNPGAKQAATVGLFRPDRKRKPRT